MAKWSIKECQDILECAIGEVDHLIPKDVIEQTIDYLQELKTTKKELRQVQEYLEDWAENEDAYEEAIKRKKNMTNHTTYICGRNFRMEVIRNADG